MTIVMEEDGFSSSLSSLNSLSPQQSNYQTLSSTSSTQSNGIHSSQQQQNSQSNSPSSNSADYNGPFAVFLFRSNSSLELFEERRISLDKPCKIGRSVAKIKPEPNNAIFDCKVLSRNHALLWHENGKFFIQDTKSSNGTFLNGNRLGKSNEDSAPFELTSGDIIQFGVDVTENTKKVTHGCITVELKLFFKPGVEATNKANPANQSNKIDVQTQEIYQLALFLQEAMMREEILNQKLNSLQKFIDQAKETSENSWLTIIDEDRLLSRIDFLEKQTNLQTKNLNEDSLKKCIQTLQNEKFNIENSAKQTIEKMIEEKNQLTHNLDDLNTSIQLRNEECAQLQKMLDESKKNTLELASKYQEIVNELEELKLNSTDNKNKLLEKLTQTEGEKLKLEALYDEAIEKEKLLNARIESLIADNDFTSKRLEGILNKLEKEKIEQQQTNNNNNESNIYNNNSNNNSNKIKDESSTSSNHAINGENVNVNESKLDYTNQNELEECNGFYTTTNIQDEQTNNHNNLNNKNEIKDEPLDTNNISFSKVEINYTVDNLLQKIEDQTNISENQQTQVNFELKNENELLNRKLEHQLKLNNQLTNEVERLESLILTNTTSNNSNKTNLNVSQQTDDTYHSIVNDTKSIKVTKNETEINTDLTKALEIINQQFDLIKLNFNQTNTVEKVNNEKLFEIFTDLDESFRQLNDLKQKYCSTLNLNTNNNSGLLNDSQCQINESDNQKKKLEDSVEEKLKEIEQDYENRLNKSVEQINNDYDNLSLQTKIVSYCSTIPLLILIFAIMVAFYPTLSAITATGL